MALPSSVVLNVLSSYYCFVNVVLGCAVMSGERGSRAVNLAVPSISISKHVDS